MLLDSSERGVRKYSRDENTGLAATLRRRDQYHKRRDVPGVHRPCMQHPERQGDVSALRQNDVAAEDLSQVTEERRAINGLG